MPILSDFHLHTSFSADSAASMDSQIRAAIAAGLESICFTEHLDLDSPFLNAPPGDPESDFTLDYEAYREAYLVNKVRYAGKIRLFFGLELGLNAALVPQLRTYVEEHTDFDFIIGSTHSSQGMDPYYDSFFAGRDPETAYRQYFADALANIRSFSDFDSYGHLDYILRFGPAPADGAWIHRDGTPAAQEEITRSAAGEKYDSLAGTALPGGKVKNDADRPGGMNRSRSGTPVLPAEKSSRSGRDPLPGSASDSPESPALLRGEDCPLIRRDSTYYYEKYADLIDPILFELILRGKALEVNTSALRRGFPEPNPGKTIVKRYHDFGGQLVTIGADAHDPGGVAYGFDRARSLLLECGFTQYTTFEGRKPVLHEL